MMKYNVGRACFLLGKAMSSLKSGIRPKREKNELKREFNFQRNQLTKRTISSEMLKCKNVISE